MIDSIILGHFAPCDIGARYPHQTQTHMSIWTLAGRRPILRSARWFSSAGNVVHADTPNPVNLSPERMRALIAMYHQAETFVTRENLDAKIDEVFTGELERPKLPGETSLSLEDLKGALRHRQDAPTVSEWSMTSTSPRDWAKTGAMNPKQLWSGRSYNLREKEVINALYGVETQGGKALPGWETLNEQGSVIEASEKEDREKKYEDSDY
ncbi:hypothetical protein B0H12DRAFT_6285 [Mycena haematopus]|nr:hypothetical protein B0H12DRAFT_6285 [Mycena haematopus]